MQDCEGLPKSPHKKDVRIRFLKKGTPLYTLQIDGIPAKDADQICRSVGHAVCVLAATLAFLSWRAIARELIRSVYSYQWTGLFCKPKSATRAADSRRIVLAPNGSRAVADADEFILSLAAN
jgi:hypothetical protein